MTQENEKPQGQRNPGASVLQRLRNHAHATGEDTTLLLARYVIERFLYLLSRSMYRTRFILRGATLFSVWKHDPTSEGSFSLHRPTRDVDLLATGENSVAAMTELLKEVLTATPSEDGIQFLLETLSVEERGERRAYPGLHAEVTALLGTARPRLEIDIAFGEAVTPAPEEVEVPTLLSRPRPRLMAYPRETVIAEKTEALVSLGINNTRLKDFFDLWYLSSTFPIDGETLARAFTATFARRETAFPTNGIPMALTERFYQDVEKQKLRAQLRRKIGGTKTSAETELGDLIKRLQKFLTPALAALERSEPFQLFWHPSTGWQEKASYKTGDT